MRQKHNNLQTISKRTSTVLVKFFFMGYPMGHPNRHLYFLGTMKIQVASWIIRGLPRHSIAYKLFNIQ